MNLGVAVIVADLGFAEGLRLLLDKTADLRCLAICRSAEGALDALPSLHPSVALVDALLAAAAVTDCLGRLKKHLRDTEMLLLSGSCGYEEAFYAFRAGAAGLVVRSAPPEDILAAVREVAAGGVPMPKEVARQVVDAFRQYAPPTRPVPCLSDRQSEILRLLTGGHRYKEVAEFLGITYDTVRTHAQNIYKKLHVHSLREAEQRLRLANGSSGMAGNAGQPERAGGDDSAIRGTQGGDQNESGPGLSAQAR